MLFSAAQGSLSPWAEKQILHFAIFFPIMLIVGIIDVGVWYRYSYFIYGITIIALIFVYFGGHTAMGATRWINIGFFRLQPSELTKISLILALARYFHSINQEYVNNLLFLFWPLVMIIVPFILVVKQPDLGTGVILLMVGVLLFFMAGVSIKKFVFAGIIMLVSVPTLWSFLHEYQKKRVMIFLNPELDPFGAGYNIIQSKIAIGSGGLLGKGLFQGSQSQLNFLPEHQTDFIFTMFAEEFGFLGALTLLVLYAIIIIYGFFIALNCRHQYGRLLSMGFTILFALHIFVNVAMVMGVLPVVGAPLPLLSYGGTIMMTMMIGFGLLISVSIYYDTNLSR
jgi:rod shape determining protein RodA